MDEEMRRRDAYSQHYKSSVGGACVEHQVHGKYS